MPSLRTIVLVALAAAYGLTFARTAQPEDGSKRADPLSPQGRAIERALAEGRPDEALSLAQDVRRAFPGDPFLSYLLATIYKALDQPAHEAEAWEEYIRTSTTPADACPFVAQAYDRLGERERALERFRLCVALQPDDPDRRVDLAEAYERAGKTDLANAAYREAAPLDLNNPLLASKAKAAGDQARLGRDGHEGGRP